MPLPTLHIRLPDVAFDLLDECTYSDDFHDSWGYANLPQRARLLQSLITSGLRAGLVEERDVRLAQRLVELLLLPLPAHYPAALGAVRALMLGGQAARAQTRLHVLLRGAVYDLCGDGTGALPERLAQMTVAPELHAHVRYVIAMLREHDDAAWQCTWLGRLLRALCEGGHRHPAVLLGWEALMLQEAMGI